MPLRSRSTVDATQLKWSELHWHISVQFSSVPLLCNDFKYQTLYSYCTTCPSVTKRMLLTEPCRECAVA